MASTAPRASVGELRPRPAHAPRARTGPGLGARTPYWNGAPRPAAALRAIWDEIARDFELLALFGVLIALCIWFSLSGRILPEAAAPGSTGPAASSPVPPRSDPFVFVTPRAHDWLLPAMLAASPPRAMSPATPAASVERHALVAEPLFDPLGAVILSGLPETAHLSAGAALSSTDWAVAFGDLDDLVIRLPAQRKAPFRTTLDLRTRAGVKIHSFTVELQQEEPAMTARAAGKPKAARKAERKGGPGSTSPGTTLPAKATLPAAKPAAGSTTPTTGAGLAPLSAALPTGFFKPDPKDSVASGLTPDLRDDPRFTTLRGLGVRPDGVPAAPAPPRQLGSR